MKQIVQDLNKGHTYIANLPFPIANSQEVLIETNASLISPGTEKMLVSFGQGNLLDKVRSQPDKVKQVLEKAKKEGLKATYEAVKSKLDQPLALGYCNVGKVIDCNNPEFAKGDRVVSNGHHAEIVRVSSNLCCKIPKEVTDEQASFAVIGAIALHGVRLAQPTLGETFVVFGMGVVGLLTVQILHANGCNTIAVDYDPKRLAIAEKFGAIPICLGATDDPITTVLAITKGIGVDGSIITAATKSNEPITQSARMCRKKGRIIMVGVTGMELSRADFFEKELTFQVSCSYGPGRYDSQYEEKGMDYPIGYVRWTENRNFAAFIDLIAKKRIDVDSLITHRYDINQGGEAYETLMQDSEALGILIQYNRSYQEITTEAVIPLGNVAHTPAKCKISVLGAGNYGSRVLIPAIKTTSAQLGIICSSRGLSAFHHGRKHGFQSVCSDPQQIFESDSNGVVIVTKNDTHASFTLKALASGKHVFVEKPLCITMDEWQQLKQSCEQHRELRLMVGFNRRFSPHGKLLKSALEQEKGPKTFIYCVNAGSLGKDHWNLDEQVGGGRIITEACHFVDFIRFLCGSPIVDYQVAAIGKPDFDGVQNDKISLTLKFEDGSLATVHYFANGHSSYAKEKLTVFCGGKIAELTDYRILKSYGWKKLKNLKLANQDKGQKQCILEFVEAIEAGKPSPIPLEELLEVTRITILAENQLRNSL